MVMFSCNRCSSALKKKDVATHSFKCGGKSNISLTCIDCLKDFCGDTYDGHTSCVSEEVRYGGKGAVSKPTGVKQNKWLGIVRQVLSQKGSLDQDVKTFLESIQHFENIPRNKKKFQNWAYSAKHIKDTNFLDRVFDTLHQEFIKNSAPVENGSEKNPVQKNGQPSKDEPKKRKKSKNEFIETELDDADTTKHSNGEVDVEDSVKMSEDHENEQQLPEVENEALTKKERKLLKKKRKFENELKEVSEYQKEEITEEQEGGEQKLKKNKKRKLQKESDDTTACESGGSKKKKTEVENEENLTKEIANESQEHVEEELLESPLGKKPPKQKFKWQEMIINILTNSKKDEMSIKRLSKKVINEYVSLYGDKIIHDKLNATFNKKLKSCRGVKVLKDKVSLVKGEENKEEEGVPDN